MKKAQTERLYDLRKRTHPSQGTFRTLQVFECWVCGGLTNKLHAYSACPIGYREDTVCPNSGECWHHELEKKLHWLTRSHPKGYKAELEREIDTMRQQCVKKVKNDLVGKPNLKLKKPVTHTFPNNLSDVFKCKHWQEYMDW